MPSFIDQHDSDIEERATSLTYRNVTKGKIQNWLRQFDEAHQPIALKLLHNLRFYDTAQLHAACKTLCRIVKTECGDNLANVVFMGLGSAGKSGAMMLSRFRHSNGMHTKQYDRMFKYATEVTALPPTFRGTLVFLDDFMGSGLQSSASLLDIVSIAPPDSNIVLLVVAAYASAIEELNKELECKVLPVHVLQENEKLFSGSNTNFTEPEKTILLDYCKRTGSKYPCGYRNVGSLVVFCDSVPNNTPSILIHEGPAWMPLFARI